LPMDIFKEYDEVRM